MTARQIIKAKSIDFFDGGDVSTGIVVLFKRLRNKELLVVETVLHLCYNKGFTYDTIHPQNW